jgi:hypothetical protein
MAIREIQTTQKLGGLRGAICFNQFAMFPQFSLPNSQTIPFMLSYRMAVAKAFLATTRSDSSAESPRVRTSGTSTYHLIPCLFCLEIITLQFMWPSEAVPIHY